MRQRGPTAWPLHRRQKHLHAAGRAVSDIGAHGYVIWGVRKHADGYAVMVLIGSNWGCNRVNIYPNASVR